MVIETPTRLVLSAFVEHDKEHPDLYDKETESVAGVLVRVSHDPKLIPHPSARNQRREDLEQWRDFWAERHRSWSGA
jgi:hypothetical protein